MRDPMREKKSGERGLVQWALAVALLALAGGGVLGSAQPPARRTAPPKVRRAAAPKAQPTAAEADQKAMLGTISADSLRGHLRFLASDLLEGRDTPSRGLDVAAEYIASQMMRAGVAPAVDDPGASGGKSYFQVARWQASRPDRDSFSGGIELGEERLPLSLDQISFQTEQAVDLRAVPLLKVDLKAANRLAALTEAQVAGKAVLLDLPEVSREDRAKFMEGMRARGQILAQLNRLRPALVLSLGRQSAVGRGLLGTRLIDPSRPAGGMRGGPADPVLTVHSPRVVALYDAMADGETRGTLTLRVGAPVVSPVDLKNVIGVIPGSDPVLRDTYVLVSAHYDHVGIMPGAPGGDNIYNGANDDASGVVSVIELASALSRLRVKPKRSLVFIAWFGEEKGLLGSRFYGQHPVFPLDRTVAMVNLEQVGRTDSSEGPQVNTASLTGFDFTDLGPIFQAAGEKLGIRVYKHEQNSDAFFGRSDNQALADAGIPAHTLCVAFVYPDYHQPGDHWEKIDYDNLARVNQLVALSLVGIAENPAAPKWNEANPKTARYVEAWKRLQGGANGDRP